VLLLLLISEMPQSLWKIVKQNVFWVAMGRQWADEMKHLRFVPVELLERLAVLTPRPRVNLILYYDCVCDRRSHRYLKMNQSYDRRRR